MSAPDTPVRAAAELPCQHCPWRVKNQRVKHPHGFYTLTNLRRLWRGLRAGAQMSCHPTDPRMADFSGYEFTEDAATTAECAGALVLVQREYMRFDACCKEAQAAGRRDGVRRYRARFPQGLTKQGLQLLVTRLIFGETAWGSHPMTRMNLNLEGIGHPDLPPWDPAVEGRPDAAQESESPTATAHGEGAAAPTPGEAAGLSGDALL